MPDLKVVSITDHAIARGRAAILSDLHEISIRIARELIVLSARVDTLREEVTRLQQGGGAPNPSV